MRLRLEQLPEGLQAQVRAKIGYEAKQRAKSAAHPSPNQNYKPRRRRRLVDSMHECRSQAWWVDQGTSHPYLVFWLAGALLASVNDLLSLFNLKSRIAYRNACHAAIWRGAIALAAPPTAFQPPFAITVTRQQRSERCDVDGLIAKYLIDGLVAYALIGDDGPGYVQSVAYHRSVGETGIGLEARTVGALDRSHPARPWPSQCGSLRTVGTGAVAVASRFIRRRRQAASG